MKVSKLFSNKRSEFEFLNESQISKNLFYAA